MRLDLTAALSMLGGVMDRMTADTEIGRILMPGPTYLGIWARDTGVAALGLNRLGRSHLAGELLLRYWALQIDEESDPSQFIFRNKTRPDWTSAAAFTPTGDQLRTEIGAFPTSVYIRTPEFPAGTREIYGRRADLDSAAWLVIALRDWYLHSRDDETLRRLTPRVARTISYLKSRDEDGDNLLEQGANEDWADIVLRRGRVSYTQAVWFACLDAAAAIFAEVGNEKLWTWCCAEREAVREAIKSKLLTEAGYFLNWLDGDDRSLHRSLDTALMVAFGVVDVETGRQIMQILDMLAGPFGPAVFEPGYVPAEIGPAKYPPGQYQNEGVWPWIASYAALARAKIGDRDGARDTIASVLGIDPVTVYEWIDNLDGRRHHADFATGAGALAWAITEGNLTDQVRAGGT
jgi:glycogen debranching enzyme